MNQLPRTDATRRQLVTETALVLGVSLGASAIWAAEARASARTGGWEYVASAAAASNAARAARRSPPRSAASPATSRSSASARPSFGAAIRTAGVGCAARHRAFAPPCAGRAANARREPGERAAADDHPRGA